MWTVSNTRGWHLKIYYNVHGICEPLVTQQAVIKQIYYYVHGMCAPLVTQQVDI